MNEDVMNPEATGMIVNEKMKADLLSSKKWANFLLSIRCLGVIGMVYYAIIIFIMSGSKLGIIPHAGRIGAIIGIILLVFSAIMVYIIIKGFQFVYGTEAACYTNDESEAARGFSGLHSILRTMGIVTIIYLALIVLSIILLLAFK